MSNHTLKSAVTIAKLLGVEGYSAHVHNAIEKYWCRRVMRPGAKKNMRRLDADFSAIMADLSAGDRLIVGKFISLRCQMNFDTGLRIGLVAHAHENSKPVFDDPAARTALGGE
jgi:hypothetical protein